MSNLFRNYIFFQNQLRKSIKSNLTIQCHLVYTKHEEKQHRKKFHTKIKSFRIFSSKYKKYKIYAINYILIKFYNLKKSTFHLCFSYSFMIRYKTNKKEKNM